MSADGPPDTRAGGRRPGVPVRSPAVPLDAEDVPADQRAGGSPTTAWAPLGTWRGLDVGVWEMTQGAMTDVEVDEVFVVVAGRAVLEVAAGAGPDGAWAASRSELAAGDVVELLAGMRTTWTVSVPLRKVYLTPAG